MSRAQTLRGFVSERLAAASREILTVVDRIVSEYEEEASGFRLEIDRQKKQLDVLLQAQATLKKAGLKRRRIIRTSEEDGYKDEEEEEDSAGTSSGGRFKRRKPGRSQISETQNHVDLRIRIIEDPQIDVLSNSILEKCPVLKLKCPPGLQEKGFLDLLRSSFPQLCGNDKHFDILTSDKKRRLLPLSLKKVTPEGIHRKISGTEWRKWPIYVRLKTQNETQTRKGDADPLQTQDNSSEVSLSLTREKTKFQESSPILEGDGCREEVWHRSTSNQPNTEIREANENFCGVPEPYEGSHASSAAKSKTDYSDHIDDGQERREVGESDGDWKPDKDDEELKDSDSELWSEATKKQRSRQSGVEETDNSDALTCKVCGALQLSEVTLIKHASSHVDDPRSLCGVCGDLSESPEAFREHLVRNHKTEDCHICGESFCSSLTFNEHVAAHSGERPYGCDLCPDKFALQVSLENHQKLHETGKPHKCHTCNKTFELRSQLKAHRMTHTHLCGVCGKSLSDYRSLSRHKMTHVQRRPHSCQVCGKSFKLLGTLRQHEKIHTDRERSYLCDVCCKMFLTSKQLHIHMRSHTNEKPYHCGECGKGFTTKGSLTIHMRVHTGETPYRCPDCGWSFKRKVHLDNHMTVHSGLKPFVCGICGKACARKRYLKVHMRTHNGERPYKCTLCDKAFTQGHCLKTHMKSHLGAEAAK
ncbi:zinc finger protein 260-like isoform X2 [Xyrichtys novacula]|uniref:Zinc finger protein 260-like isoform X2 n=1 Tax=Xyrichtys novacula TaxID=13765 RepID=A0AAV1EI24_XYRNO|nr:zinc finger protein 260-like isoform X2 [Xyrichtys novacula]